MAPKNLLDGLFQEAVENTKTEKAVNLYLKWLNKTQKDAAKDTKLFYRYSWLEKSKKWWKIWIGDIWKGKENPQSKSIFTFIDPETGDMYKPAGWKAPAKGARANVFNLPDAQRATTDEGISFGYLR